MPDIETIESRGRLPSLIRQANTLLRYIGDEVTRTGVRLDELPQSIPAIVGAIRPAAMQRVEQLRGQGIVSRRTEKFNALSRCGHQYTEYCELNSTLDGLELYER